MTDDKILLLEMHGCTAGLSAEILHEMAAITEVVRYEAGQYVHRANQPLASIYLMVQGRLKQTMVDTHGKVVLERLMTRGSQLGVLGAAQGEPIPVNVIALEPSTLLRLDYQSTLALTRKCDALRLNFLALISDDLRRVLTFDRHLPQPSRVLLLHESSASRLLTARLIARLLELGEHPCVLSDAPAWKPMEGVPSRPLKESERILSLDQIRRQIQQWPESSRVLVDADAALEPESAARLFEVCDQVFWCVSPDNWQSALARIQTLVARIPEWKDKIHIVWLLEGSQQVAPWAPELMEQVESDFKISFSDPRPGQSRALANGLERLVHELRGIRIGLALGGGAARGMAHLGVFKALEQHGICVDMIAGTSAGAMTGIVYASGMEVDYSIERFMHDLKPSWPFQMLPRGKQWYLLYKYRRGHFDPMLRRHLLDRQLEQLPIPSMAVAVDLVSGEMVVRDRGDAVHAIVESINVPGLSVPIYRNGKALVDGGLVNNIPANVLVERGCNFVIAVSVTAMMEHIFARNRPDTPTDEMRPASTLQTMLRSFLVQSKNMNSVGVQPADYVIEPDVTQFDLTDFDRTDELAAVGEQAAQQAVAEIKTRLADLDDRLFV